MKKLIPILLALLMLCSCTVGPMEEAREPLVTPDASAPDNTLPVVPAPEPEPTSDLPEDETIPPDDTVSNDDMSDGGDDSTDYESGDEEIEIDESEFAFLYATISLNVRSGPSTDYEAIGFLNAGEEAEVLGYAGDYGWYLISFNGGEGFVSGSYMTPHAPNPAGNDDDGNGDDSEDFPAIDISDERIHEIIYDLADRWRVRPYQVEFNGHYGDYPAGTVVAMSFADGEVEDYTMSELIGDYTLKLPKPTASFYVYTTSGDFLYLRDAYANGLITDSELRAISYFTETVLPSHITGRVEEGDMGACEDPELVPLDNATKAAISADYDKANNLPDGTAYVVAYYGTYNGSHAVVMWQYDPSFLPNEHIGLPQTEDISEFTVYGRRFILMSGSYSIKIHTPDGRFLTLKDAISQGVIKESDLDMMSYHNLNGNR